MNIVFFDGVCNLCSRSVQFIIKHDNKNCFKFSSLQSNFAKETFKNNHQISPELLNSIVLINNKNQIFTQSSAVLKIASKLRFPINLLAIFLVVPKILRDWTYKYVAKRRYNWFGKKDQCWLPNPQILSKFIN
jgi:predicted DCC family thiol-disulfide oxidoreductase YuxK